MAQPQLKLSYFDLKLHAELSRMIFNYGGIAFTDHRIARTDFVKLKPTLPFGQVPVLELDGTIYAQSMAIARYAAKIVGPYPNDALEALKKKKVFTEEMLPKFLASLEKMVAGKFIQGDELSYADIQFLGAGNMLKLTFPDFKMGVFPQLTALLSNVKAEPKIAAYLSKQ
ncbi:hypothetical protein PC129_g4449 [Phytophthora cactorum]|uniref:Thioredoxin-like fold n=1 Tax=Phytophthora cactorum TaxID=29920 RepID=A0A329SXX4_9STRA|nr:hypothetical protein PC112_g6514 [Phytophthora cactorum]KAG2835830.1 hypothetical protein PC111_g5276 [Phytophthora cactorum]KAG2862000.1 hypothetical protein PC113_g6686 [Phytophthora cactorum]KAG2932707.1 hypothetical protein PC115_g5702 [Phytophthora cactorum]KAG2947824.1 hypothetical protein PC117_g6512 [Phytophthora cactorum]